MPQLAAAAAAAHRDDTRTENHSFICVQQTTRERSRFVICTRSLVLVHARRHRRRCSAARFKVVRKRASLWLLRSVAALAPRAFVRVCV